MGAQQTAGPSPSNSSPNPPTPGTMGGLSTDGEEATAPEDVSKWTVDDVCSFVGGLSGCGEYASVRGHLPQMAELPLPTASSHP